MSYFDFRSLIDKYSCTFTVLTAGDGTYNDLGDFVTTETETTKSGAVMSISESKIYRSDGVLTAKDKELFMNESLGDISKLHIVYEGEKYSVESNPQNNHQFTGVWQYTLKWVSAFGGGDFS